MFLLVKKIGVKKYVFALPNVFKGSLGRVILNVIVSFYEIKFFVISKYYEKRIILIIC